MNHFRMPAEWEKQAATWMSWPNNLETWPDNLAKAQAEFADLVRVIASTQQVNLMTPRNEVDLATSSFGDHHNVNLVVIETNDAWARDYAPTFVVNQEDLELVAIDWYYNAWGEKYPPFDADQQVAKRVADHLRVRHVAGGLCLEGGAIEVSEDGVLLTTTSCALNPNRNAGFSKKEVESILRRRLGCRKIVWLPGNVDGVAAIPGDDTDGHIDQLARFADNKTIVHAWVDPSDPRRPTLEANVESLQRQLPEVRLVPLMLPQPFSEFGRQIPASYCNFLITNESVIVPQFGAAEDSLAIETLSGLFSGRAVVALPSRNLAVGLGSFHCLTQQQPA